MSAESVASERTSVVIDRRYSRMIPLIRGAFVVRAESEIDFFLIVVADLHHHGLLTVFLMPCRDLVIARRKLELEGATLHGNCMEWMIEHADKRAHPLMHVASDW